MMERIPAKPARKTVVPIIRVSFPYLFIFPIGLQKSGYVHSPGIFMMEGQGQEITAKKARTVIRNAAGVKQKFS